MQTHYGNMQDVMRRDQAEKERAQEEAAKLRKENKHMAIECEGLREAIGQVTMDRDHMRMAIQEYEGIRE